jgi:hypothetical protein
VRDEEYEYRSFQQGGANTHTAKNSMATLHDILVDCIMLPIMAYLLICKCYVTLICGDIPQMFIKTTHT